MNTQFFWALSIMLGLLAACGSGSSLGGNKGQDFAQIPSPQPPGATNPGGNQPPPLKCLLPPSMYVSNYNHATVSTCVNERARTIRVGEYPTKLALTRDGSLLYVVNYGSYSISVIDTALNAVIQTIDTSNLGTAASLAITPDGRRVYAVMYASRRVVAIDTATHAVSAAFQINDRPNSIAISPDGKTAFIGATDATATQHTVYVLDIPTNTVTATLPFTYRPFGLAFTPDGRFVYVSGYDSLTVSAIDTVTQTVTANISLSNASPVLRAVEWLAITPDSRLVYAASGYNGNIYVIDTATNTVANTIFAGSLADLALSPDGLYVYVSQGGRISVLDTSSQLITQTYDLPNEIPGFNVAITGGSPLY